MRAAKLEQRVENKKYQELLYKARYLTEQQERKFQQEMQVTRGWGWGGEWRAGQGRAGQGRAGQGGAGRGGAGRGGAGRGGAGAGEGAGGGVYQPDIRVSDLSFKMKQIILTKVLFYIMTANRLQFI